MVYKTNALPLSYRGFTLVMLVVPVLVLVLLLVLVKVLVTRERERTRDEVRLIKWEREREASYRTGLAGFEPAIFVCSHRRINDSKKPTPYPLGHRPT